MLDATLEELMPRARPAPTDEPGRRADHVLLSGPLFAYLEALITTALAHSGALNTDEDPKQVLCEAADLTELEYDAVVLRSEGQDWERIAKRNRVTAEQAEAVTRSGIRKLRLFIQG